MKTRRNTLITALMAVAMMTASVAFAKDDDRAAAVKSAELSRFQANVDADSKALSQLLDDNLEYVHSNGDLDTKSSFIEALVSGKRDYVAITPDIQSVRVVGDAAIIRGTAQVTVSTNGESRNLSIGYTDVWLWKDKRWQMTAWRSAPKLDPAVPPAK